MEPPAAMSHALVPPSGAGPNWESGESADSAGGVVFPSMPRDEGWIVIFEF